MKIWTYTKFHLDANRDMVKCPYQYQK